MRKRLPKIVIGAELEPLGLVVLAVLRREQKDRSPVVLVAQRSTDLVTVHTREHDVEHDCGVLTLTSPPQAIDPVVHDIDGKAVRFQTASDRVRQPFFVVHYQDAHPRSVPART